MGSFLFFLLLVIVQQMFVIFILAKNVASDIAEKLCNSVATKLEGKVLGTFSSKYCWTAGISSLK